MDSAPSLKNKDIHRYNPFYAITIWLIASAYIFYKYFIEVAPNVMNQDLMRFFHASGTSLGILGGAYFLAYMVMQVPLGMMLDHWGPRIVITVFIFLCAVGTLIFALSPVISIAILARALTGAGAAVGAIGCLKIITMLFPTRYFSLMIGSMMAIGMLGAMTGQAPLNYAITHFEGWQNVLFLTGILGLILAVLFWLATIPMNRYVILQKTIKQRISWSSLSIILKEPKNWYLAIYSGLVFSPIMVLGGLWGVTFIETVHHLSRQSASNAITFIFVGFVIGAPLFGWLSEVQGKRLPILRIGTAIAFVILAVMIYGHSLGTIILSILCFLLGFFVSSFLLSFSLIREMNLIVFAGTTLGFMNMFNGLTGAIAEPMIGFILEHHWTGTMAEDIRVFSIKGYQHALSVLPIVVLIALILTFTFKETFCQQREH